MTAVWDRQRTSIEYVTLRYRGSGADDNLPTLRLRTERLLGSIDLQPPGLPSGALLIVRKLQSSLSGFALQARPSSTQAQAAWVDHLRTQLASLYRTAVRPALHPVSPAATSVLFIDAAEMLTCFTRDILNERVWQQWYWQQMLRHVPRTPAAALTAMWSEQAAFVPGMVNYLRIEEIGAAIALLTTQEVSQIIAALNASFELPSPQHMLTTPEQYSSVIPPWQRWFSSSSTITLTPQAQYLLGLIVTLHHAPAFARSTNFIKQAISWLDTHLFRSSFSRQISANSLEAMSGNGVTPLATSSQTGDEAPASPPPDPHKGGHYISHPLPDRFAKKFLVEVMDDGNKTTDKLDEVLPLVGVGYSHKDIVISASQPFPAEGLLTELGGILYLIHLLKWLDLPASWPWPAMLAQPLSGWGIIELLARGLLWDSYHRYADDPIWHMLAVLDKREPDTLIGTDLPAQTTFRLPAKWLLRYGTSHPTWLVLTDGLRLYFVDEEAGYLIVDVPLVSVPSNGPCKDSVPAASREKVYTSNPKRSIENALGEQSLDETIHTEVDAYRAQGVQVAVKPGNGPRRDRGGGDGMWGLGRLTGFVLDLLIHALNEPAINASSLPEYLLCKRGRLVASRTHVDLYMSMEQISIPIRRAGLDCDPSWVPDLGYIVLFHFGQET